MAKPATEAPFYSSLVAEHIVQEGRELEFKQWHQDLTRVAENYAGFLRCDLCPPIKCQDPVVKCYYIIHFDSPAHLDRWLESSDRRRLQEMGQSIFYAYRFKSFTTGLEGWFSAHSGNSEYRSLGAPRWKQILAVVLGLYPLVMIQAIAFSKLGIMQSWSLANSMLVNNLITSTILSLLVMPLISQRLSFWLQPAYRPMSIKKQAIGTSFIVLILGLMLLLFNGILSIAG